MSHDETVRREFARQAGRIATAGLTLSSQEYLAWMVGQLPLESGFRVLDVAGGTGHLARAIAPHVREVVAVDMTPEMLAECRAEAEASGLDNVKTEIAAAEALPHGDDSFDMVVCRLGIHHFAAPGPPLAEMVRVCQAGRCVAIMDTLGPDDDSVRETCNRLERMRDPSHTTNLTEGQLVAAMEEAGLTIASIDSRDIEVDFHRWADMTDTPPEAKAEIERALTAEIEGGAKTGQRPFMADDRIKFLHTWATIIGTK